MHILITDSGVGGLSVCAYAEKFLRTRGVQDSVKLTYVNASPENDFGYNSMGSRSEKIKYFDRFLSIVSRKYSPDQIYIACNTLSVLFSDTQFSKFEQVPVHGIVETGINLLLHELNRSSRSKVVIFGTDTTIEENTYSRMLEQGGIEHARIISQACPSLADTISEDLQGLKTMEKIEKYVDSAIEKTAADDTDFLAYLACTHFGYRKDLFAGAFEKRGLTTTVLNPNEFVVEDLFEKSDTKSNHIENMNEVSVEFITRYRIPETALETIAFFLEEISPKTVRAFTEYTHVPGLF